ncbi:hypothetical protein H9P43_007125 [Blastocladiella emersonii ATCC 22665]|nr:hypothetical protein H9P43_007125 [Blastocladiella emersonii ATCC 22665]
MAPLLHLVERLDNVQNLVAATAHAPHIVFLAVGSEIRCYHLNPVTLACATKKPFHVLRLSLEPGEADEDAGVNQIKCGFLGEDEVLVSADDLGRVAVWPVSNLALPPRMFRVEDSAWGIAIHQDLHLVAVSCNAHTVTVFDLRPPDAQAANPALGRDPDTGVPLAQRHIAAHSNNIPAVAISASGCILASVSIDSSCRLWDLATGECIGWNTLDDWGWQVEFIPPSSFEFTHPAADDDALRATTGPAGRAPAEQVLCTTRNAACLFEAPRLDPAPAASAESKRTPVLRCTAQADLRVPRRPALFWLIQFQRLCMLLPLHGLPVAVAVNQLGVAVIVHLSVRTKAEPVADDGEAVPLALAAADLLLAPPVSPPPPPPPTTTTAPRDPVPALKYSLRDVQWLPLESDSDRIMSPVVGAFAVRRPIVDPLGTGAPEHSVAYRVTLVYHDSTARKDQDPNKIKVSQDVPAKFKFLMRATEEVMAKRSAKKQQSKGANAEAGKGGKGPATPAAAKKQKAPNAGGSKPAKIPRGESLPHPNARPPPVEEEKKGKGKNKGGKAADAAPSKKPEAKKTPTTKKDEAAAAAAAAEEPKLSASAKRRMRRELADARGKGPSLVDDSDSDSDDDGAMHGGQTLKRPAKKPRVADFDELEDKVRFGDVAQAPPTLKVSKKMQKAKLQRILADEVAQNAVRKGGRSLAEQRQMDGERLRMIQLYRDMKAKRDMDKVFPMGMGKPMMM